MSPSFLRSPSGSLPRRLFAGRRDSGMLPPRPTFANRPGNPPAAAPFASPTPSGAPAQAFAGGARRVLAFGAARAGAGAVAEGSAGFRGSVAATAYRAERLPPTLHATWKAFPQVDDFGLGSFEGHSSNSMKSEHPRPRTRVRSPFAPPLPLPALAAVSPPRPAAVGVVGVGPSFAFRRVSLHRPRRDSPLFPPRPRPRPLAAAGRAPKPGRAALPGPVALLGALLGLPASPIDRRAPDDRHVESRSSNARALC